MRKILILFVLVLGLGLGAQATASAESIVWSYTYDYNDELVNQKLSATLDIAAILASGATRLEFSAAFANSTDGENRMYIGAGGYITVYEKWNFGVRDRDGSLYADIREMVQLEDEMSGTVIFSFDADDLLWLASKANWYLGVWWYLEPADASINRLDLTSISITGYGPSAVPAPAAFWLLGSGLAGLVALRKKQ